MDNIVKEEIEEYIDEEGNKVILKKLYIVVEDEKWKSQKNYYEKNKGQIKKYVSEYNKNRYNEDEEFREKVKTKRRERYAKKKEEKESNEKK